MQRTLENAGRGQPLPPDSAGDHGGGFSISKSKRLSIKEMSMELILFEVLLGLNPVYIIGNIGGFDVYGLTEPRAQNSSFSSSWTERRFGKIDRMYCDDNMKCIHQGVDFFMGTIQKIDLGVY